MNKYLAIFGKPRYLGIVAYEDNEDKLTNGEALVVESYRGEELAVVAGELTAEQEKEYRLLKNASESGDGIKSSEPVVTDLTFIKFASEQDLDITPEYRVEEQEIFKQAKELLKPHNLDMKLIDVEFLRRRRKLFFYFSSEQRVDFRAYVRDLAHEFKTRIELRQIGVRDEAKIIRGISPCGQPCCCSYWLNQFAPINIRMVKEQNLALNPSKISGICGRLMCCMHYEHKVYHEIWAKLPNPGSKIKTPNGNVIVAGIDLTTESVRCFVPGRGEQKIPINQFDEFKQIVLEGKDWNTAEEIEAAGDSDSGGGWASGRKSREPGGRGERRSEKSLPADKKTSQPQRREKPVDSASSTEQTPKKKRRKRGRGGAQRSVEATTGAVKPAEKTESKQETQPRLEGKEGGARRKPRRRRSGSSKNKGNGGEGATGNSERGGKS